MKKANDSVRISIYAFLCVIPVVLFVLLLVYGRHIQPYFWLTLCAGTIVCFIFFSALLLTAIANKKHQYPILCKTAKTSTSEETFDWLYSQGFEQKWPETKQPSNYCVLQKIMGKTDNRIYHVVLFSLGIIPDEKMLLDVSLHIEPLLKAKIKKGLRCTVSNILCVFCDDIDEELVCSWIATANFAFSPYLPVAINASTGKLRHMEIPKNCSELKQVCAEWFYG